MTDAISAGYPASLGVPCCDSTEDAPWLRALKRSALERFHKQGLPTTRDEDWRHTNVSSIATTPFRPATSTNGHTQARSLIESWGFGSRAVAAALVFLDGRFSPELSAAPRNEALRAVSMRELWPLSEGPLPALYGRALGEEHHAFAGLNTAYAEDGALVSIARGSALEHPIYLIFLSAADDARQPTVSHPRALVHAEHGSQASIVSVYAGAAENVYLTNAVTEVVLEDGATLDYHELQIESPLAFHISTLATRQGRDCRFVDLSYALGARLARRDVAVRLDGEGGECGLYGLYVADGDRLLDTHTRIDHARPHTRSREVYKGVLDGSSRGVFHGRIVVRPDAQKIDAHQVNNNLILSDSALASSTPQLQIHANDVRCTHASTTGQLDPLSLFYLRSRGIDEATARNLLTYAFACEIVGKVRVPGLRGFITRLLEARLSGAPTELCS